MTDAEHHEDPLLARMREGDEDALAEAFSRYRDRLRRLVTFRLDRRMYGRVDADDILQEAFLNASQRIAHFFDESEASFFIWLRLIVCQTLIEVHRRHLGAQVRDAGREFSLQAGGFPTATSTSLAAQLAGDLTTPSRAVMNDELRNQLEQAIGEMSSVDQEILALRHFEELSNKEVAEVLQIEQKAASIRYVRALARLQKILVGLGIVAE